MRLPTFWLAASLAAAPLLPAAAQSGPRIASAPADSVEHIVLSAGRVHPMTFAAPVTRLLTADTTIADAIIVSDRDIVLNAHKIGETDVLLWTGGQRRQYRVEVRSPADRPQIVLAVKFAEVRRDALRNVGIGATVRNNAAGITRGGLGVLNTDAPLAATGEGATPPFTWPTGTGIFTVLSDFGRRNVLAAIDLEEQRGRARTLAEPTLMAANRDSASFLAGGEFPIPAAVAAGTNGQPFVTIVFKEFGVRLTFAPEIVSDTLVKLRVRPEVSSLDYTNAVTLSGVRIPALRTRRLESTVDVPRDQSLVISGLLNDQREQVRTGIPGLVNIPILGALFSSTRWQHSETELVVVVTPVVIDPAHPRPQDTLRLKPDTKIPAEELLRPRLVVPDSAAGAAAPAGRSPASPSRP